MKRLKKNSYLQKKTEETATKEPEKKEEVEEPKKENEINIDIVIASV